MAAPVTTLQVLYDNIRNCVVKFTFISGGADQAQTTVVDVTALHPPSGPHMKVRQVHYDVNARSGSIVRLLWDAPPNPIDILEMRGVDHQDFRRFGGISTVNVPNATGSILVETQGFSLNDGYSVTLEMVKDV